MNKPRIAATRSATLAPATLAVVSGGEESKKTATFKPKFTVEEIKLDRSL